MTDLPQETKALLNNIAEGSEKILRDNFIGLYVHGSIAMGCFNPFVSDIDFLIVVRTRMSITEKRAIVKMLLETPCDVPKGMEMSVVLLKHTRNPIFPIPFELHFSRDWQEKYQRNEVEFDKDNSDPDLAAHFMITKKRGVAWCGLPIDEVFAETPKELYLQSLFHDFCDFDNNLIIDPVYAILNACRTAAYLKDALVLSKKEGGEWALRHFDESYLPVVRQALSAYASAKEFVAPDENARNAFALYARGQIKGYRETVS